jgi:hypothetical protein
MAAAALPTTQLWRELWTSLASLLRSYTAAHGLNRLHQATVELGEESIIVRTGDRWLQLDRAEENLNWLRENGISGKMHFTIDGKLEDELGAAEEMDMQAESWARELMQ